MSLQLLDQMLDWSSLKVKRMRGLVHLYQAFHPNSLAEADRAA
ncbi:hypothetical protein [Sneathiella glossodoripedis]|nr:hypothetical protein [Sneathiella glossodoripedis]